MRYFNLDYGAGEGRYLMGYFADPPKCFDCSICGEWTTIPDNKNKIVLTDGWRDTDILSTIFGFLVTQKIIDILKKEKLTGWKFVKANIIADEREESRDKKKLRFEDLPPYYRFIVTGDGGNIHKKCGCKVKICKECGKRIVKCKKEEEILDKLQLDGSDFFCVEEFEDFVFCTEKVKEVFNKYKIKNVEFDEVKAL